MSHTSSKTRRRRARWLAYVGVTAGAVALSWQWLDHVGLIFIALESFSLVGLIEEPPFIVLSFMGLATLLAIFVVFLNWIGNKLMPAGSARRR